MNQIDCVIIGHNTGNFRDYIAGRKSMSRWNASYLDAQINSLLLNGNRVSYMELFNMVRKQVEPEAEVLSPFDPLGLASLHLASFLSRQHLSSAIVAEFQKGKSKLEELLRDEPVAVAITTTFYFEPNPVQEIVSFVRQRSPNTAIIVGGPYPSHLDRGDVSGSLEMILEELGADVCVIDSQGESTLARVVAVLKRTSNLAELESIPNLVVFEIGRAHV